MQHQNAIQLTRMSIRICRAHTQKRTHTHAQTSGCVVAFKISTLGIYEMNDNRNTTTEPHIPMPRITNDLCVDGKGIVIKFFDISFSRVGHKRLLAMDLHYTYRRIMKKIFMDS